MENNVCICKYLPTHAFNIASIKRNAPGRKVNYVSRQRKHLKSRHPRIEKHNRK